MPRKMPFVKNAVELSSYELSVIPSFLKRPKKCSQTNKQTNNLSKLPWQPGKRVAIFKEISRGFCPAQPKKISPKKTKKNLPVTFVHLAGDAQLAEDRYLRLPKGTAETLTSRTSSALESAFGQ